LERGERIYTLISPNIIIIIEINKKERINMMHRSRPILKKLDLNVKIVEVGQPRKTPNIPESAHKYTIITTQNY